MKDNNKIPQYLYNVLYIQYADTVLHFRDDPELLLLKRKHILGQHPNCVWQGNLLQKIVPGPMVEGPHGLLRTPRK